MEEGFGMLGSGEFKTYYPEAFLAGVNPEVWRVLMNPIPPKEEVDDVLSRLSNDAEVGIGKRGQLRSLSLPQPHVREPAISRIPGRPYLVEVEVPATMSGVAGDVHPKARIISPEISRRSHPGHPHINFDETGDSWACPLSPHETVWSWKDGGIWAYLAQVSIWIVKSEVWARTGGGLGERGIWLGNAMSHEPLNVLLNVEAHSPCRCGSGGRYEDCHWQSDFERCIQLGLA
jgi:hypothetical protein